MTVPNPKEGECFGFFSTDHIVNEKDQYKVIILRGFDYKLFEEEEGGVTREGKYGYPYVKHIIQLWSVDWMKHMEKINKVVGIKNYFTLD